MRDRLDILNNEILALIKEKKAKPDKTIEEHTIDLLFSLDKLKEFGYIQDDSLVELVEKACIYHDIGKINDEFQKRVTGKSKKFNEDKEVVHNILSLYFIDSKSFKNNEDYHKVANSVLNHHNYCNNFDEMSKKEEHIQSLLEKFNTCRVKRTLKAKLSSSIEDLETIKIKGYLHKCDYSASAGTVVEYPNRFLEDSLNNLLFNWKANNNEASWNTLQQFCIQNRDENIIAIAQTGMGKTEAGLLWIGDNKGFFVLPIRTAINAIYDRVRKDILNNDEIDKRVAILHSSSLEYYIRNINSPNEYQEEIDLMNYHKVGMQLAIPLNISTMDQIFDFVYKYQGYELKLTTLSYSKIVIDEIQAYGPDLLAYLIYGLERVVQLGGKIAILTATLPPFVKDLLKKNVGFKENEEGFTNNLKRHNLKVLQDRINSDDIYNKYQENKGKNKFNKILVVCNTIKEAQKIYEELKNDIPKSELNILHSKFIRKDRLEKESEIIEFGKTFDKDRNIDKQNGIWISTSIVEASLDIDFDYLFTELQELNSLFQRLGRCNRKGKKDSSKYNCFIYTDIDAGNLTNGDKGFIDKRLYELSKEAILSYDGQISEKEKINLIKKYLTTENLKGSDYMREYKKVYNYVKDIPPYEFDLDKVDLRNILSTEIIPSRIYKDYYEEIQGISNRLVNESLTAYERVELKDKINKYTVSVHPFDVNNYERALRKGQAVSYSKVYLSRNSKDYIRVIECEYDEVGYKRMQYDNAKRESNIW
ncbi:CRISPR-associated helicase Cas3' [Clostridium sp.]|uniref:CRISPR-associated helicase Cas3' n=1 Tax=Clostridium sp. TaxID=1506 RepID=UPI003F375E86